MGALLLAATQLPEGRAVSPCCATGVGGGLGVLPCTHPPTHPPIRRICEATNSPLGGTRSPHPLATTKSSRFQAGAVQGCAKRGQPACSCQGQIPKAGSMPEVRAAPARKPSPVQRIPVCQGHPWVQGAPGGARAGTGPVAVLAGSTGPGGGRAAGPPRSRLLQMAKAIRAALARTEP